MMTRYNQLLCVIGLTFMVGCTDCSDMSDDDVTASTPLPDTTIPTEATEPPAPPVSIPEAPSEPSIPMSICGDVNQAPIDDVPAPTNTDVRTVFSMCDEDDLDSEYTVWYGDATIEDLESLETYTLIKGRLDLGTLNGVSSANEIASLERIDLPELQVVCGSFIVHDVDNLTYLNLPQLEMARTVLISNNGNLPHISLPQFETVDQGFRIRHNKALQSIDLPKLQTVHGDFFVEGNDAIQNLNVLKLQTVGGDFTLDRSTPVLRSVDLPWLKTIGGFGQIRYHKGATSLNLSQLESVGGWFAISSNKFTCIDLSQLQTVGSGERRASVSEEGFFYQSGLGFYANSRIPENLVLPQLQSVEGDIVFKRNSGINTISMPQLQNIGHNLEFENSFISNIELPQLQFIGGVFRFDDRFNPTECNLGSYTNAQCP